MCFRVSIRLGALNISDDHSIFSQLGRRGLAHGAHEQLEELLAARDQMEHLLRVIVEINTGLDAEATLQRIISAAMELTDAPYGAFGVRGENRTIASFLHAGLDEDRVRKIGRLPVGKGLLGLLLDQDQPLRLDDLTAHPTAVGFPEHHPRMRAFLGVPIVIRGSAFGSLFLADDHPTRVFTESDELVAGALASAGAAAIENAQLFERVHTSAQWTNASREFTTALLADGGGHVRPLQLIADRARELIDAEQAIVLVPPDEETPADEVDTLVISAAAGLNVDEVIGQSIPVRGSTTGAVFHSGTPVITDSFRHPIPAFTDVGERPAVVMPLRSRDAVIGVIVVARNVHQQPFDTAYLELISDFADRAAVALTLAASREQTRELMLLTDRERIAHDLHDHVIQRLFAAGMDLQGTISRAHAPQVVDRLTRTVDDLQDTINEIRTTIFKLQTPAGRSGGLRDRIQHAVADLTSDRDITTTVRLSGPLSVVGEELADHAESVVMEATSNTVRHSGASTLTIDVTVADNLVIEVVDNGRGVPADNKRRSGLANLQSRAEQVGGTCDINSRPSGGTQLLWTAPLFGL